MMKNNKKEERTQWITTESGLEVIINHDRKDKCENCKAEIVWALVPLELVGLAEWDFHKCKQKIKKNEK